MNKNEEQELENMFSYHAPKEDQPEKYERIRVKAHMFAKTIVKICPDCEERKKAIARLSEMVMWANAAIARHS